MDLYNHYQEVYDDVMEVTEIRNIFRDKKTDLCFAIGDVVNLSGEQTSEIFKVLDCVVEDLKIYKMTNKTDLVAEMKKFEKLSGEEDAYNNPPILDRELSLETLIKEWSEFLEMPSVNLSKHYIEIVHSLIANASDLLHNTRDLKSPTLRSV
jgi:hypothetical protein